MPENQVQAVKKDVIEIDVIELLYYYLSKLGFIILGLLLGGLAAGLITYFLITPKYTAEAKLYMVSSSTGSVVDLSDLNIGTSISADYEELVRTRPLLTSVIESLNLPYTFEELLEMLEVSTITNTRILVIEVTSTDPDEARAITNKIADEAVTRLPNLMDTPEPHIAESAVTPEKMSSPSLSINIMLGSLGVAAVVIMILTLAFVKDDTMKTAEDVEKEFGVMPLTVIPEGNIGILSEKEERNGKRKSRQKRRRRKKLRKKEESA